MKKEPLFDLINSMTMSEKRFFKIFSQRHVIGEKNQYSLLFDAIESSHNITNETLTEKEFVKNLSAEKNYLYRLILKSLNAYYFEFSCKMKVQNLIISAEILAYKGLDEQALKLLQKAEKLAEKAELFANLLTIKQTQFEILSKLTKYNEAAKSIHDFTHTMKQVNYLADTQLKATQFYELRKQKGGIRSTKDLEDLNSFLKDENPNVIDSIKSKLFSISFKISHLHANRDFENELIYIKEIIIIYEQNPFLIEYSEKGYISSLYNLANTYRNLKDYKNALIIIDKLDELKNHKLILSSKSLSSYIFYLSNNLRLFIYIIKQQYNKALEQINQISNEYSAHESNISKPVVYEHLMLIIRVYMEFEEYKTALKYTNVIINDTSFKIRNDILTYVRLLNLIIHFELKNDFTL